MIKHSTYFNYLSIRAGYFSTSAPYSAPKERPKLTIETQTPSTGNEGLDKEREWRIKSSMCEHTNMTVYLATADDEKDPMLCDIAGDSPEEGKTIQERELYPDKHPAVFKEGDTASVCQNCFIVICDNCKEDYSDEECDTPTPSQMFFPTNSENFESGHIQGAEGAEGGSSEQHPHIASSVGYSSHSQYIDSSASENTTESENQTQSSSGNSSSLIDDFADVSTEMPDYIDFDS